MTDSLPHEHELPPASVLPPKLLLAHAGIAAAIAAAVFALCWRWADPAYVTQPDAIDYAQMGRALARGDGFATEQMFPRHLAYLHANGLYRAHQLAPPPNLYRYPVQPLLNALAQRRVADPQLAAALVTSAWTAIGAGLLFMLGARLFGAGVAALATAIYATDVAVLGAAQQGLTEPTATALVLAAVLLALAPERMRPLRALALGAVCGVAFLARTQLAYGLPLAVAFVLWRGRDPRRGALVVVGGLLALVPWLLRNLSLTGSPLFSFSSTRNLVLSTGVAQPDLELSIHAPVALRDVLAQHGPAIADKVLGQLFIAPLQPHYWVVSFEHFRWPWLLLAALGVVAASWQRSTGGGKTLELALDRMRTLGVATLVLHAANVAMISLLYLAPRFQLPLRPLVILLCASGVGLLVGVLSELLAARARSQARVGEIALCGLAAFVLMAGLPADSFERAPVPNARGVSELRALRDHVAPGELVASDSSALVSLLGDRRSLRLPADPAELFEIDEQIVPIDWLLLSSGWTRRAEAGQPTRYARYREWIESPAFRARFEPAFRLAHGGLAFRRRALEDGDAR